jgi:hypothetical protein
MITLQATGEIPIEFEGTLLNEWTNNRINGSDRNRFHAIDLYDHADGGYVGELRWRTQWQGESENVQIRDFDTVEEFVEWLNTVDPIEHLQGFPSGVHFQEKQRKLETQVISDWKILSGKILSDLGVKKTLRRGKPSHPLGVCANPGWSIPEQIRTAVLERSKSSEISPSEIVTGILATYFEINHAAN